MVVDTTKWNSRTQEVVKKYGLPEERARFWGKVFGEDDRSMEIFYLSHFANHVFGQAADCIREPQKAIELLEEAKSIYQVWDDITGNQSWEFPLERIKLCDEYVEILRSKLKGPDGI